MTDERHTLRRFPVVATSSLEVARDAVTRVYLPHALEARSPELAMRLNAAQQKRFTLGFLAYGAPTVLRMPPTESSYHVNLTTAGNTHAERGDGERGGMFGALGALAALEAGRRTGRGQVVDASIYESVLAVTEALVTEWQKRGVTRERSGPTLPGIAPSNVYPTLDGQVLLAANQDSVFRRLVALMGRSELATDPRFANHQARGRNMAEIDRIIAEWTSRFTSAEVLRRLHEAGVPAGLVYEPKDMFADPHFAERGSIAIVPDERHGELAMQAVVPHFSETPGEIQWAGQALGADTDAVLIGLLGLSPADVEKLRSKGVVGAAPTDGRGES